ncbi:hypothetical protein EYF80_025398 [Liparis tanakae]|uniref:Uncharacterized protein n=1 Tax=Liparis tanakae TaxID=230148 RepID=A0A4Z2HER1_9TELE|nr:hypothetical protein EYF80_025398 [Liparis tanakae]
MPVPSALSTSRTERTSSASSEGNREAEWSFPFHVLSKTMKWNDAPPSRLGRLADQRGLLQGDEDGAHAGHILGLLAGLGVEVTEPGHPLPLRARVVLIQIRNHGILSRPTRNKGEEEEEEEERTRSRTQ